MDTNDKALQHIRSMQSGTQQPDLVLRKPTSTPMQQIKFEIGQDLMCKTNLNFPGRHAIFAYKNEICTVQAVSRGQIELVNAEGTAHYFPETAVRAYFSTH